VYNFNL